MPELDSEPEQPPVFVNVPVLNDELLIEVDLRLRSAEREDLMPQLTKEVVTCVTCSGLLLVTTFSYWMKKKDGLNDKSEAIFEVGFYLMGYFGFVVLRYLLYCIFTLTCSKRPLPYMWLIRGIFLCLDGILVPAGAIYVTVVLCSADTK